MSLNLPPQVEAELEAVISHYPQKRSASLMLLHGLQEHFGFLSKEAIEWTATRLDLQPINIYELVTFYPMFRLSPVGQHHFRVCRTLSCALGGAEKLREHLCQKLGLDPHCHQVQTRADGKVSLEAVECLAGCGTAPVMMCNETFYEGVSAEKADRIVAALKI